MNGFRTGKAVSDDDTRRRGGWFLGHFMNDGDLSQTADVEVKWGIHKAGERNEKGFVANKLAKTMSILVSGQFLLSFRNAGDVSRVELIEPGSYAIWEKGVEHDWEAITDCTIITVRWPSVRNDQVSHGQSQVGR